LFNTERKHEMLAKCEQMRFLPTSGFSVPFFVIKASSFVETSTFANSYGGQAGGQAAGQAGVRKSDACCQVLRSLNDPHQFFRVL
jgi:hypothetical protein